MENGKGMVENTRTEDVMIPIFMFSEAASSSSVSANNHVESRPSPRQQPSNKVNFPGNRAEQMTEWGNYCKTKWGNYCAKQKKKWGNYWTFSVIVQSVLFFCSLGCLIASITVQMLKNYVIWVLELWKWCVVGSVVFCGIHIIRWMVDGVVCLIKRRFAFIKGKQVYYTYYICGLRKSIIVFLWFGSVFLTWHLLLGTSKVKRSKPNSQILSYITRSLATTVIGGGIWVVKTLLVNILSSSFQVTRYFRRILGSVIDQYILEVFSAYPKSNGDIEKAKSDTRIEGWMQRWSEKKERVEVIDWLLNIEAAHVSAWPMEGLINLIRSDEKLSKITDELEKFVNKEAENVVKLLFIEDAPVTKEVADEIFDRVHHHASKTRLAQLQKQEAITSDVLKKAGMFSSREVRRVIQQITNQDMSSPGKITIEDLRKWLVKATVERRSLAKSLTDTKRAMEELNKLVSGTVLILLIIFWLLILEFLTKEGLILILSQFFVLAFVFGNTAKSVFEGIIFVFMTHPFDIDDRCLINGEVMVVERINLLTTVFRKNMKDKIIYPNSVLITLPIRNFYKGIIVIDDSVEITIRRPASDKKIKALTKKLKKFLKVDPKLSLKHAFELKDTEDDKQKMKVVLYVSYCNINLQRYGFMKILRRKSLVKKLKKFFDDLDIETYNILPQAVDLGYSASLPSAQKV